MVILKKRIYIVVALFFSITAAFANTTPHIHNSPVGECIGCHELKLRSDALHMKLNVVEGCDACHTTTNWKSIVSNHSLLWQDCSYCHNPVPDLTYGGEFGYLKDVFVPIDVSGITIFIPLEKDIKTSDITRVTHNSVTITWESKVEATTELLFAEDEQLSANPSWWNESDGLYTTLHSAKLVNLIPNKTYYYKITSRDAEGYFVASLVGKFQTLVDPEVVLASAEDAENERRENYTSNIAAPSNLPAGRGKSEVPYWMQYANSRMNTSTNETKVYFCDGEQFNRSITHYRRQIGNYLPGFNESSGLPAYWLKCRNFCSFSDADEIYNTAWYLNTGQDISLGSCITTSIIQGQGQITKYYSTDRVVWPGEVTNDGWGVVPMSEPKDGEFYKLFWIAMLPPGKKIGRNGVQWENNSIFIPDNILYVGLGNGPSSGRRLSDRASSEIVAGRFKIYISGVCTSNNCLTDLNDYKTTIFSLNDKRTAFTRTTYAVLDEIYRIKTEYPGTPIDLIGHSLGAAEAVLIYNLPGVLDGSDMVYALSPPILIHYTLLLGGSGQAQFIAYSGKADPVSNNLSMTENSFRQANGVNLIEIDTGKFDANNAENTHDRCKYLIFVFGSCVY